MRSTQGSRDHPIDVIAQMHEGDTLSRIEQRQTRGLTVSLNPVGYRPCSSPSNARALAQWRALAFLALVPSSFLQSSRCPLGGGCFGTWGNQQFKPISVATWAWPGKDCAMATERLKDLQNCWSPAVMIGL
ncbi:MAG: hypothetical protein ACK418_12225 [Pseudomonas sp.]|uniref:hypothetical protein n=1 Tax=Pseudomonas sp. TaxID=306 RepID=UPI00391C046F